jgi:hypothetical protein
MSQRIIRVFPRKTRATPDDDLVRINCGPDLLDEADEVHISVSFTWDLARAEKLARAWGGVAPVKIGGPATGERAGEFVPGRYLKRGWVITSRGCDNRCEWCEAWKRNGNCQPLPITEGHIVQDDNILGNSDDHIIRVFDMLRTQREPADLRGLEAKILLPWHVELFKTIRVSQLWFAYDEPDDYLYLVKAGKMLKEAGFNIINKKARSYVLCGYDGDTQEKALIRMRQTLAAGFVPFAMLYRDLNGVSQEGWSHFIKEWTRPAIMFQELKKYREENNVR